MIGPTGVSMTVETSSASVVIEEVVVEELFMMWSFQVDRRATDSPRGGALRTSATGAQPWARSASTPSRVERMADAEIGVEEHVGVAEAAHHDVVGRPRSDPAQPQELLAGDGRIGADVQLHVAGEHCGGETPDRVSPSLWHRERLVRCGERVARAAGTVG